MSSASEIKGRAPVRRRLHLVLLAFEVAAHQLYKRRLIVDH